MAERVIIDDRADRRGTGLAAAFTFLMLLIALAALILAFLALHRANNAVRQANSAMLRTSDLSTKVDNATGALNKASSGAGSGQNTTQAIPASNPTPNGSGQ